jgi:hypothetical protein
VIKNNDLDGRTGIIQGWYNPNGNMVAIVVLDEIATGILDNSKELVSYKAACIPAYDLDKFGMMTPEEVCETLMRKLFYKCSTEATLMAEKNAATVREMILKSQHETDNQIASYLDQLKFLEDRKIAKALAMRKKIAATINSLHESEYYGSLFSGEQFYSVAKIAEFDKLIESTDC